MSYWEDKVVLVTGGSAGLGREIAAALARRQAKVVISARDQQRLDAASQELRQSGGELLPVVADMTDDAQVESLIAAAVDRFGRLDAVVNNVGQSSRCRVLEATPEQFQQSLELNLLAAVRCTRAAAGHLIASRGHLVNIGSLASKTASPFLAAYSVGKFALAAYSQQLRLELGPQGVHVLLVCPGPIRRNDTSDDERYREQTRDLPQAARKPGGGASLKGLDPARLAEQILRACERRKAELVVPGKARLLFAVSALWPTLGDWILERYTQG